MAAGQEFVAILEAISGLQQTLARDKQELKQEFVQLKQELAQTQQTLVRDKQELKQEIVQLGQELVRVERNSRPEKYVMDRLRIAAPNFVVGMTASGRTLIQQQAFGTGWTFSYVRSAHGELFAIGAAHCSFKKRAENKCLRVYVPTELAHFVVAVICSAKRLRVSPSEMSLDALALVLSDLPPGVTPYQINEDLPPDNQADGTDVVGISTSVNVVGQHLKWGGDVYVFQELSGEPGNSGTATFAVLPNGHLRFLGVYIGDHSTRTVSRRPRGLVVPLTCLQNRYHLIGYNCMLPPLGSLSKQHSCTVFEDELGYFVCIAEDTPLGIVTPAAAASSWTCNEHSMVCSEFIAVD